MKHLKSISLPVLAGCALAFGSFAAYAHSPVQSTMPARSSTSMSMHHGMNGMNGMMGKHNMTGTVTSINKSTGMIRVKTDHGDLRLHFPPSSLTNVKDGDSITLHLSFSKSSM